MRILFFILFFQIVSSQESFQTIDNFLFDSSNNVFKIISGDSIFSYDLNKKLVHKNKFLEKLKDKNFRENFIPLKNPYQYEIDEEETNEDEIIETILNCVDIRGIELEYYRREFTDDRSGLITALNNCESLNIEDEYELLNPSMEYYYDRTGRKGNLFRKQDNNKTNSLEINKAKFDNVNSVLNKLEIYPEQIYNTCN